MPEDDPGSLSPEDAKAVAAYIHGAFYSSLARERNRPARIELARLTVAAVPPGRRRPRRHLPPAGEWRRDAAASRANTSRAAASAPRTASWSAPTRRWSSTSAPTAPCPDKIEPHEFSIRWNGSLLAPETGEYEFVVRTEHAARLWVNDTKQPADRRLGQVRQRHRIQGIAVPGRRPGLPAPAGVHQGQAGRR